MTDINPTVNFSTTGVVAADISSEDMRSLLRRIEAELHGSEVYQIAMQSLQKMLGEAATKAEIVIRAVGREAIQLSVKQFLKQNRMMLLTADKATTVPEPPSAPKPEPETPPATDPDISPHPQQPSTTDVNTIKKYPGPPSPTTAKKKKLKKLTPAQKAEQAKKKREFRLCQIGKKLKKTRESYSISLQQVHHYTLIPIKLIEALEAGDMDRLPEDIYIRGFICRIANALGLDGSALASYLPTPSPDPSLTRSWSKIESDSGFYLNSTHLYLGYVAILAGSLGGIAWLSNQPIAETQLAPDLPDTTDTTPDSKSEVKIESVPGLESDRPGIVLGADIAPPERMSPELIPQQMTSMELGNFSIDPT